MTENKALPPKPTPGDLAREARRLERIKQLESSDERVIQFRPAALRRPGWPAEPASSPDQAA